MAIPSKHFQGYHAFLQLVMLADTLWHWLKRRASHVEREPQKVRPVPEPQCIRLPDHALRAARLKLIYAAAKIYVHDNRNAILYSPHEQ